LKLALILLSGLAFAADPARVVFTKSFPGSVPAYVGIQVARDGSAVYQEAPNDDAPVTFQVSAAEVEQIFALAAKLDYFKKNLESNLKVANMGMKTFRWENGPEKQEAKFNYSLNEDAKALADWFEKLTETQQHLFNLERAVKFDRLGVNKMILQLEAALDRGRIVGPERLLPMLDRVSKNDSYLHMARERAAALAEFIRNPKPKAAAE